MSLFVVSCRFISSIVLGCIIIEDKNGGQGKGYPNPDQTFQAEFNELLFISIALKLDAEPEFRGFSCDAIARLECSSPPILRKIHERCAGKWFRLGLNFREVKLKSTMHFGNLLRQDTLSATIGYY